MNIDEASKMKPPKHSGVKWKKSGDEWLGTFKTKNLEYDLIWSDDDPDTINYDNGYTSGNDSVKGFFKTTIKQEEKDYKEMYESKSIYTKEELTARAIQKVEDNRETSKPDFDELGEAVGRLVKKVTADGVKKVKRSTSGAQASQNSGLSAAKRKLRARKTQKTKRRTMVGAKKNKQQRLTKKAHRRAGNA